MKRLLLLGVFGSVLGCGPPPVRPGPKNATPPPAGAQERDPDMPLWLGPALTQALGDGARHSKVLAIEAGIAGDRLLATHALPESKCALFVARVSPSVADVDLFLFGDDGSLLASDESPDRSPSLLVCPPHPKHVYAVARIAAGEGFVAIIAQEVDAKQKAPLNAAIGQALVNSQVVLASENWAGIEVGIAEHRRLIGGEWHESRRVALPLEPDTPTQVTADIPKGGCLDVLALPSEEVGYLDLTVQDTEGRYLTRGAARGTERSSVLCSPERVSVTISLRPHVGRGVAALVLAESGPGIVSQLHPNVSVTNVLPQGKLSDTAAGLSASLSALGYGKPVWQSHLELQVGERKSLPLTLGIGCFRLDILSEAPVRLLAASVWNEHQELLVQQNGMSQLRLFPCATSAAARLDLETITRPGKVILQLRREQHEPKLLTLHPLAAARLIGSLVERERITSVAHLATPQLAPLAPTRIFSKDLSIPSGNCLDVSAALGPGATGIEVRLLDAQTAAQLALGHGPWLAFASVCAPQNTRALAIRAELRVSAGEANALLVPTLFSAQP